MFILGRPRVVNFADIIKTATMFIKTTTFKDSGKVKKLEIIYQIQSIFVFLDLTKLVDFW